MSIWQRIGDVAARIAEQSGIGSFIDRVVEAISSVTSREARRRVAFSVAMIALSAKMAKADGVVTQSEVEAFRQLFSMPPGEEQNVARLFNLAKQDIAGFEAYAQRIRGLYPGPDEADILEDIVDGLFHIAKADGIVHEREVAFLSRVAEIFGIGEADFEQILVRHVHEEGRDPYAVLGIGRAAADKEIKQRYRRLAAETHPDRLIARGVPEEFVRIANDRLAAINDAYGHIARERGL